MQLKPSHISFDCKPLTRRKDRASFSMPDLSALNHNYLTALLSAEKLPSYQMPAIYSNGEQPATPKQRKPRSDKGVSKPRPSAQPTSQVPVSAPATPKKRKQSTPPTPPPSPAPTGEPKPKKPRARIQFSIPEVQEPAAAAVKPRKPRAKKVPAADAASSDAPAQNGHAGGKAAAEGKHELTAAEVRYKGMNHNALDKIKSVNAPPTDAESNVPLPGYPSLGSIFAEIYSTHRTVDNRLSSWGQDLTKFMAAQFAVNQDLHDKYEKTLEEMKERNKRDREREEQQQHQTHEHDSEYSNIDLHDNTIVPLTP